LEVKEGGTEDGLPKVEINRKSEFIDPGIIDEDYGIAYDFATKAYREFDKVIKSIVLFGSVAKNTQQRRSDVDIIIIVDDATIQWDQRLIAWYREEMQRLVSSVKYAKKLHVNTVTLTAFWNQILIGEPVVINVLRYGIALIDFGGFFNPLKILLARGKIRPSPEAIYTALKRAPLHLARAKFNMLSVAESVYWAMVDSAHAALMAAGKTPPSPEHIDIMLKEHFVRKGKLNSKYVNWYRETYRLAHNITHGTVVDISGKELNTHRNRADKFIGQMAKLVKKERS